LKEVRLFNHMATQKKIRIENAHFIEGYGGAVKPYYDTAYFVSVKYRLFYFFDSYGHACESNTLLLQKIEIPKEVYERKDIEAAKQIVLTAFTRVNFEIVQFDKLTIKNL
jgi:hypothetical protein